VADLSPRRPSGILKPSALTRRLTDAAVLPGGVPAPPTGGRRTPHDSSTTSARRSAVGVLLRRQHRHIASSIVAAENVANVRGTGCATLIALPPQPVPAATSATVPAPCHKQSYGVVGFRLSARSGDHLPAARPAPARLTVGSATSSLLVTTRRAGRASCDSDQPIAARPARFRELRHWQARARARQCPPDVHHLGTRLLQPVGALLQPAAALL